MNFGLNPHWGVYLPERMVSDWANYALSQGFSALEITIDSRMLAKGLDRIFDRGIQLSLKSARRRGLRFHISFLPHQSPLARSEGGLRSESIQMIAENLRFLENALAPHFVILHPGQSPADRSEGLERLCENFQLFSEQCPHLRLGLKIGEEREWLITPEEILRLISRARRVELIFDVGATFLACGDDLPRIKQILLSLRHHLYEVHWRNISYLPPRDSLPLRNGYLKERHYLELLASLPSASGLWHILDYRDRTRREYPADKLMLEDLAFRVRSLSAR